jgi:hypothetical protein
MSFWTWLDSGDLGTNTSLQGTRSAPSQVVDTRWLAGAAVGDGLVRVSPSGVTRAAGLAASVAITVAVDARPTAALRAGRTAEAGRLGHGGRRLASRPVRRRRLSAAFEHDRSTEVSGLLESYQRERLSSAQSHVERSRAASEEYLQRRDRA